MSKKIKKVLPDCFLSLTVFISFVKIKLNPQGYNRKNGLGGSIMLKKSVVRTPICLVLALLMCIDFAIFNPSPVHAVDTESVLIGAGVGVAAGAGIVLAAPAIAGAVSAAGGIAGIGTAIVGGATVAGGVLLNVVGTVSAAVGVAGGAVLTFLAGIVASPLFIPALIIIAAVIIGIYAYRQYKKNQEADQTVISGSDEISVTPGDYDMNPCIPPMTQSDPITIGDSDTIAVSSSEVAVSDSATAVTTAATTDTTADTADTTVTQTISTSTDSIKQAHDRYVAAYTKYTQLVTTGGSGDIKTALKEYKDAYKEYMDIKTTSGTVK